jgi:uncharacterized protein
MVKKIRTLAVTLFAVFACVSLFGSNSRVSALAVPPAPTDIPIVDTTNTLSEEQKNSLANSIAESRAKTSNQIAILMIPSLENGSLEEYSIDVARQWGVGTKDKSNGVLILIVKNDRKIRIEVGYGLEGALTDAKTSQIIRNVITPEFRQDKYFEGISSGVQSVQLAIQNEFDPALENNGDTKYTASFWEFMFFAVFFGLVWLSSILARSKSWWGGGVVGGVLGIVIGVIWGFIITGILAILLLVALGLLLDRAVSKNYAQRTKSKHTPSWWAGGTYFGGGSSGGGGFGGFGGGGFGGGGSSGSW